MGAQFGRWERGECRPRPPLRRVVCELYEASAEALGLLDQGDGTAKRRDLLRNVVVLGAAAVVSPAWSGEGAAAAPEEPAEVASIRDALMNYDDLWDGEVTDLVDLPSLERQVQQAWQARQAAAYRQLGVLLPPRLDRCPARRAAARQRPPAGSEPVTCRDLPVRGLCHGEPWTKRSRLDRCRPRHPRRQAIRGPPDAGRQ
jgi:hypothetical protein